MSSQTLFLPYNENNELTVDDILKEMGKLIPLLEDEDLKNIEMENDKVEKALEGNIKKLSNMGIDTNRMKKSINNSAQLLYTKFININPRNKQDLDNFESDFNIEFNEILKSFSDSTDIKGSYYKYKESVSLLIVSTIISGLLLVMIKLLKIKYENPIMSIMTAMTIPIVEEVTKKIARDSRIDKEYMRLSAFTGIIFTTITSIISPILSLVDLLMFKSLNIVTDIITNKIQKIYANKNRGKNSYIEIFGLIIAIGLNFLLKSGISVAKGELINHRVKQMIEKDDFLSETLDIINSFFGSSLGKDDINI